MFEGSANSLNGKRINRSTREFCNNLFDPYPSKYLHVELFYQVKQGIQEPDMMVYDSVTTVNRPKVTPDFCTLNLQEYPFDRDDMLAPASKEL